MASQLRSFYGCYLLRSLDPAARIRTYIGFTVNPRRRIRQHNGEISSGAWRTKRGRPWEMVLVVYGFPTHVQALQFEWAWQHPEKSKVVRTVVAQLKASQRKGLQGKVHILMGMLCAVPWCYYPLTLQILSQQHVSLLKACSAAPPHMLIVVAPMDQLPLPGKQQQQEEEAEEQQQQQHGDDEYDQSDHSSEDEAEQTLSERLALRARSQQQQQGQLQLQQQPRRRRQKASNSMPEGACSSGSSGVVLIDDSSSGSSDQERGSSSITQSGSRHSSPVRKAPVVVQNASAVAAGANTAAVVSSKRRGRRAQQAADASEAVAGSRCGVCQRAMERFVLTCHHCGTEYHTDCLATALLKQQQQQQLSSLQSSSSSCSSMPSTGRCLSCTGQLVWQDLLAAMKPFGAGATASQRQPRSRTRKKGSRARGRSRSNSKTRKLAAAAAAGPRKSTKAKQKGKAASAAAAAGTSATASSPKKGEASKQRVSKKAASKPTESETDAKKASAKVGRPRKQQHEKSGYGSTSDSSSSSSKSKGRVSRSTRGPVIGAAAAWGGSDLGLVSVSNDLPALSSLADHLAQQYPDLMLPSDPQQLAALLLGQRAEAVVHPMQCTQQQQRRRRQDGLQPVVFGQQPQEQQQQRVCSEGQPGSSFRDWIEQQQQQPWQQQQLGQQQQVPLDLAGAPGAFSKQHSAVDGPGAAPAADATAAAAMSPASADAEDVVDLCDDTRSPSPPPLLARLKLASPLGKRDRAVATAVGTAVALTTGNAALNSGGSSPLSSSSSDLQENSSSQCAAVRRLRLNGTTPVVMTRHKAVLPGNVAAAGEVPGVSAGAVDAECVCLLDD